MLAVDHPQLPLHRRFKLRSLFVRQFDLFHDRRHELHHKFALLLSQLGQAFGQAIGMINPSSAHAVP